MAGREIGEIARAFHAAVAAAVISAARSRSDRPVAVSGGVFQNALLLDMLQAQLGSRLWYNTVVPANDGGLSLGQAAAAGGQASRGIHLGKLAEAAV